MNRLQSSIQEASPGTRNKLEVLVQENLGAITEGLNEGKVIKVKIKAQRVPTGTVEKIISKILKKDVRVSQINDTTIEIEI